MTSRGTPKPVIHALDALTGSREVQRSEAPLTQGHEGSRHMALTKVRGIDGYVDALHRPRHSGRRALLGLGVVEVDAGGVVDEVRFVG